jgi:hypothetical protein
MATPRRTAAQNVPADDRVRPNRSVVIPSGKYRASPVMTPGEYDALPTLPSTCKVPLMSTMVPTGKSFAAPPFLAQMGKVTRRQRQPPPLFSISAGRHTAGFLFQSFLRFVQRSNGCN